MNWYENLTKSEVPPEYLWEDSTGLEQWWATVQDKREDSMGGDAAGGADRDQTPAMTENDLARSFKKQS